MQVFDRLSSMGSLYQQFHEWAALLQDKARQAHAQGDPTAAQTLQDLEPTLAACREGAQMHATPLCALASVLTLQVTARASHSFAQCTNLS